MSASESPSPLLVIVTGPGATGKTTLAPLLARAQAVQVHCWLPPEECVRRFVARFERGERHPAHFDGERIARVRSGARTIDWSRFEALDLGVPVLRVDTSAGYTPCFDAILAFVRATVDGSRTGLRRRREVGG